MGEASGWGWRKELGVPIMRHVERGHANVWGVFRGMLEMRWQAVKPQFITCKTCGLQVRITRKKCREVAGSIELIANCHGMWHVDIVSARSAKPSEVVDFLRRAERMPPNMEEARRIYGPPPGIPGEEAVAFEVRSPSDGEFIVDELDKTGGWVAQRRFDDVERAEAYKAQRQQDVQALKGAELVI